MKSIGAKMQFLKLLLAVFEALPILDKWFQQLVILYTNYQREKNNVEFINALDEAKKEKNVHALRSSIGSKLDN